MKKTNPAMSDGGITVLNPCSLPAKGGRLFRFYIKGCIFIPLYYRPVYATSILMLCVFIPSEGSCLAVLFSYSGGDLALPLGLSQTVPPPPFAPIGGRSRLSPTPPLPNSPRSENHIGNLDSHTWHLHQFHVSKNISMPARMS